MEKIKMYKIVNKKLIYMNVDKTMIKEFRKNGFDVITIDNISLYYEFMSDEDLEKYRVILRNIFYDRKLIILKSLNFINSYSDEKKSHYIYDATKKHQSFFGIKDTLKPIEEYIAKKV